MLQLEKQFQDILLGKHHCAVLTSLAHKIQQRGDNCVYLGRRSNAFRRVTGEIDKFRSEDLGSFPHHSFLHWQSMDALFETQMLCVKWMNVYNDKDSLWGTDQKGVPRNIGRVFSLGDWDLGIGKGGLGFLLLLFVLFFSGLFKME